MPDEPKPAVGPDEPKPAAERSYHIGDVGTGARVAQGENIAWVEGVAGLPGGESLVKQFDALLKRIAEDASLELPRPALPLPEPREHTAEIRLRHGPLERHALELGRALRRVRGGSAGPRSQAPGQSLALPGLRDNELAGLPLNEA